MSEGAGAGPSNRERLRPPGRVLCQRHATDLRRQVPPSPHCAPFESWANGYGEMVTCDVAQELADFRERAAEGYARAVGLDPT